MCTRLSWAEQNRDRLVGLLRALRRGVEALYEDPNGAAEIAINKMSIKPEYARRACRDFVSKAIMPRDLSIDPLAFGAVLEAMQQNDLIQHRPRLELEDCANLKFLAAAGPA